MDLTRFAETFAQGGTPLVRTDFGSDAAWQAVVAEVVKPVDFDDPENSDPGDEGYSPFVVVVDDRAFEGITGSGLGESFAATDESYGYVLLADGRSMTEALSGGEITLDYVDLSVSDPEDAELFGSFMGRTFRCVTSEVASIECNLSIDNMDFSDFADNTDPDGVFRGFGDG